VRIEKCPLSTVLLSCSRLHAEYSETPFVKNLNIILFWDTATVLTGRDWLEKRNIEPKINVLSHIRQVILIVDHHPQRRSLGINWNYAAQLFDTLKRKSGVLHSIQITEKLHLRIADTDLVSSNESSYLHEAERQSVYLPPTPITLAGLPLAYLG
jgi:hypothetical protein